MSARKFIVTAFLLLIGVMVGTGQNCYVQLDDASGYTTPSNQLASLENAACELIQAFPQEFQDSFKVFDFGFYLHQEKYERGFPYVFADKLAEVEQMSHYFLLFGKQTDQTGLYSRIWMDIKLPSTDVFECMDEAKRTGLMAEFSRILQDNYELPTGYAEKEVAIMERLGYYIEQLRVCCYMHNPITSIDSALLDISVCIDNNCQDDVEGTIALISSSPFMPEIAFTLEYYDTLCTSLTVVLDIHYERVPPSAASRSRNDTTRDTIENVTLGIPYVFDYGEVEHWGHSWPEISGGIATIEVYDAFGVLVEPFSYLI